MKASVLAQLQRTTERHEELSALLSDPETIADQNKFRSFSQEYAQLEPIVNAFNGYQAAQEDLTSAKEMLNDSDPEMKAWAKEEIDSNEQTIGELEFELRKLLLPEDPNDAKNIFLEVRAGTGGDEAAIFAGDLFRMYSRYAEGRKWQVELLSENEGEHGGYREVIARIQGDRVYSRLKYESGAHRVQRVPDTESQGRIHTSACTVAILPELDEIDSDIEISPADLRVDTFRASGAGGQHVNKTDSAIRLTHLPSGMVVECQDERSQHKNRARAMSLLKARLLDQERNAQSAQRSEERKLQVGTGDRSERIRTYNYPQGRVTDHRIGLTLYKLSDIMEGDIEHIVQPLLDEHQAMLLNALESD